MRRLVWLLILASLFCATPSLSAPQPLARRQGAKTVNPAWLCGRWLMGWDRSGRTPDELTEARAEGCFPTVFNSDGSYSSGYHDTTTWVGVWRHEDGRVMIRERLRGGETWHEYRVRADGWPEALGEGTGYPGVTAWIVRPAVKVTD